MVRKLIDWIKYIDQRYIIEPGYRETGWRNA